MIIVDANSATIEGEVLCIKKNKYLIQNIVSIEAVQLNFKHKLVRPLALGTLFALLTAVGATSAFAVISLFSVGLLLGFITNKNFELRAEFKAEDETGIQKMTLMRSARIVDFEEYLVLARQVSAMINISA